MEIYSCKKTQKIFLTQKLVNLITLDDGEFIVLSMILK